MNSINVAGCRRGIGGGGRTHCTYGAVVGMVVVVVQHGEKAQVAGDPGLTSEGERQAATTAGWLVENCPTVAAIVASPLRRAQETARPIGAAFGLGVATDARFRERMNWDDDARLSQVDFLREWQRATSDRSYQPIVGDSSLDAADRFIAALADLEHRGAAVVVVVAHGGVTVDALRTLTGDETVLEADPTLIADGVPSCAITQLAVGNGAIEVVHFPSTRHLTNTTRHRRA